MSKIRVEPMAGVPEDEFYASGHRTCQGCGPALACRLVAKAAGGRTIFLGSTGCMYVANTSYYSTPWIAPWMHTQLGAIGSAAVGTAAGLRALMRKGKIPKEKINVVGLGGDGGAMDIGLSSLSGAMTHDQDHLIVLYDNESYANTGIQASSLTPWGANTTFTPPGAIEKYRVGNPRQKKNAAQLIAAGHPEVKYVATASIAYPQDLISKVRTALAKGGPTFIHLLAPCPKGWGFPADKTIDIGKLAVETGMWRLYEIVDGKRKESYEPSDLKPVKDYIRMQDRFSHLTDEDIEKIQEKLTLKRKIKVPAPV
jgi:pyruvate/2-oxoacid:ferredoxin oxidoreductase beta subunit